MVGRGLDLASCRVLLCSCFVCGFPLVLCNLHLELLMRDVRLGVCACKGIVCMALDFVEGGGPKPDSCQDGWGKLDFGEMLVAGERKKHG